MKLITVNAGSSSLRLSVFYHDVGELQPVQSVHCSADDITDSRRFRHLLEEHDALDCDTVIHRVVHGGDKLVSTCRIDHQVESEIARVVPMAPLHNQAALNLIHYCREVLGDRVIQLAAFDTGFFRHMPSVATTYALPHDLCQHLGIRRYGFHGLAHYAMWSGWRALKPDIQEGGKVITLQLGSGCSITAIDRGTAIDTSMGFTPVEGLVMATRCGDVDPGLIIYLQQEGQVSLDELDDLLNRHSGLLGISGRSDDMRELLAAGDTASQLAVDVFCYRVRKYIGAYLAVLGGCEAILIGGGIGENSAVIREKIFAGLEWLGIDLDVDANRTTDRHPSAIHSPGSRSDIRVIPVDEAMVMAREAVAFLATGS
jgi:acetate kinase